MIVIDTLANERAARLAAGRAKLAASGKTPRQRGKEKVRLALDWIYRWGYSSPTVIDILSGTARCGFPMKLVKHGLCTRTRTKSGGVLEGVPNFYLTLTDLGINEAERFRDTLLNYVRDPYRVNQDQMRHDLIAQTATANLLMEGRITDFLADKELSDKKESERKVPDTVWIHGSVRTAVEVELSAKWSRRLDEFVTRSVKSLLPGPNGEPARFDMISIVSDSDAILNRYQAAFSKDAILNYWERDEHDHWRINKEAAEPMPKMIEGKISWLKL
ncbi:hypothetical protein GALL_261040 [mine drainage metagenome]|uniref:Uncharacterized protein n=1 Tax=mine drainage metagenome TaxID=410659 RepID=A0A1J5R7J2_9ZZZZ